MSTTTIKSDKENLLALFWKDDWTIEDMRNRGIKKPFEAIVLLKEEGYWITEHCETVTSIHSNTIHICRMYGFASVEQAQCMAVMAA